MWSRLCTDFDPEDETANFKTRMTVRGQGQDDADDSKQLYEVVTFSLLEPEGPVTANPTLVSACLTSSQCIAVALDSCLHIIKNSDDENGEENSVSGVFADKIDALCWSPCHNFVIAGLQSGQVQMLHLETKKPLPAVNVAKCENESRNGFVGCQVKVNEEGSEEVWLFGNNGNMYSVTNMDFARLDSAILEGNIDLLRTLHMSIEVKSYQISNEPICSSCEITSGGSAVVATESDITLVSQLGKTVLTLPTEDILAHGGSPKILKAAKVTTDLLFCLDDTGTLLITCLKTLCLINVWAKEEVLDFVLMEEDSGEHFKILMTVRDQDTENLMLQLREFPSFKLEYHLPVSKFCHPLDCCINQESPKVVEGSYEDPTSKCVRALRVRGIVECVLEARLQRLIRRQRFDEAEKFAKSFRLPIEDVYKAKVAWIMEVVSPWGSQKLTDQEVDKHLTTLRDTLVKITDLNFVVQSCVTAAFPSLDQVKEFLILARTTIQKNTDKEVSIDLMVMVSRTLQKLETFYLVNPNGDVDCWLKFYRAKPLNMCKDFLSKCQTESALLMWTRHRSEITLQMPKEFVLDLLEIIPKDVEIETLLRFLNVFLPDCLNLNPECLPAITSWASRLTRSLEISRRREWPEVGLSLAEGVLQALCFTSTDKEMSLRESKAQLVLSQQRSNPMSELSQLESLIDVLKDLKTLHRIHRLRVKLADFVSEDKSYIIALVLDWCTGKKETEFLIQNFLSDFIQRSLLDLSTEMSKYLIDLIDQSDCDWHCHIKDAPWEQKASAIVPFITSVDKKAECILHVAQSAPVPWSPVVEQLCEEGSKLLSPLAKKISEQKTMVGFKQILRKYECRKLINKGREFERLLQYIIKRAGRDGYKDALELCRITQNGREFDAHLVFVKYILSCDAEMPGEAIKVMENLINDEEEEDAILLAERVIVHVELLFKYRRQVITEGFISFLAASSRIMRQYKLETSEDYFNKFDQLKRSIQIYQEFKIVVHPSRTTSLKMIDVQKYLKTEFENEISEGLVVKVYVKLMRLSELSKIAPERIIKELLSILIEKGQIAQATKVTNSLVNSFKSNVQFDKDFVSELINLVLAIDKQLVSAIQLGGEGFQDFPSILINITSLLVSLARQEDLLKCVEISKWQYFVKMLSQRFHQSDNFSAVQMSSDPFRKWKFDSFYEDKGLPLNVGIMEPFVNCLHFLWNKSNLDKEEMEEVLKSGNELFCQLKGSAHTEMALSMQIMFSDFLAGKFEFDGANVKELIPKVLAEKKPDFLLAVAYLGLENKIRALNILSKMHARSGADYGKLLPLGILGVRLCNVLSLTEPLKQFRAVLLKSAWGKKLSEFGISLKDAFQSDLKHDFANVLEQLVSKPNFPMVELVKFCEAFELEGAGAVIVYIQTKATNLEPIVTSKKRIIKPSNFNSLKQCIQEAMPYIHDINALRNLYLSLLEEVSPYNYEVLEFVIDALQRFSEEFEDLGIGEQQIFRASQALGCLSHYDRIAEPGEKEKEMWEIVKKGPLPEISRYRIPLSWLVFKATSKEKFHLLKKELRLENLDLWTKMSKVLKLSEDTIRIYAVQNAIDDLKASLDTESPNAKWMLSSVNRPLMEKVLSCIEEISDPQKASSCAHWFTSHLPLGFDKVLSARGSENVAREWCRVDFDPEAENALQIAGENRIKYTAMHILHKYDLGKEKYLEMVENGSDPVNIIRKLYEDESILERSRSAGGRFPDINKAVSEIAEEYQVSAISIKISLLDEWLQLNKDSQLKDNLEESFSDFKLTLSEAPMSNDDSNGNSFIRCCYIAQECSQNILEVLLSVGFSEDPFVSTSYKLKALKCLVAVADEQMIRNSSSKDISEVKEHLINMYFMSRLEKLTLSVEFKVENKFALVESVLRSCGHRTDGISLVVDLCLHFGIFDSKLWENLLKQMVRLGMTEELLSSLLELNNQPHLWHFPAFVEGWNWLLLRPFSLASIPISPDQRKDCEKSLHLLRSCPIANDVNIKLLWGECHRLDMQDLAEDLGTRIGNFKN